MDPWIFDAWETAMLAILAVGLLIAGIVYNVC